MLKEIFMSAMAAVLVTIILLVVKDVLAILKMFLQKKQAEAQEADNKSASAAYAMAVTVLDSIAETTVSRIEATQASAVRAAVKNGEMSFTELTKFSEDAYQDIVKQLSPVVMESLETCVKDTEALIRNKIEEVLPKVKEEYSCRTSEKQFAEVKPSNGETEKN